MNEDKEVILEGFHVCKHAVRFGAEIVELVTPNKNELRGMLEEYAPDTKELILETVREISRSEFASYSNISIRTPLAGRAMIPQHNSPDLFSCRGLVIVLDQPRDLENIGAVVRVAAGMGVEVIYNTGDVDPWHKNCLRGGQGLHFALSIYNISQMEIVLPPGREVVVFDKSGGDILTTDIANDAVLVFGSERQGVPKEWLQKATKVVKIPQRVGVSSYNLATSVAMGLYHVQSKRTRTQI